MDPDLAVLGDHTYVAGPTNQDSTVITGNKRTAAGRAPIGWTVEVAGTNATRTGEIYYRELTGSNASAPVWQSVITKSVTPEPDFLQTNRFWYSKASVTPAYVDGNLTNDGRWVYTWDAENRLTQMETTSQATTAGHPYTNLKFVYDWQGKRTARTVWQGGTATTPTFKSNRRWIYEGWNVIAELSATTETVATVTRINTFTWGLDLSGTMQGAGGVGGLLIQSTVATSAVHRCSYDGNGNIVAWTKSDQAVPVCRREYDAFGNILIAEGASPSSYGFSTKMEDVESGLCYYGLRYYDPRIGRWPSRDPIEEEGGLNLYAFVGNDGINRLDILGLAPGDTIEVNRCQIYVYYGHLSQNKPLKWDFNGRCSLGGAIGCYPETNNAPDIHTPPNPPGSSLPDNHRIPGFPTDHDDPMVVGDGDRRIAINRRETMNGGETTEENEHGMPWALENLSKSIEKSMDKMCKSCCTEVEFILHVDSAGDNSDLQDGIDRFAPSWKGKAVVGRKDFKKTLKCGSPVKLP